MSDTELSCLHTSLHAILQNLQDGNLIFERKQRNFSTVLCLRSDSYEAIEPGSIRAGGPQS